MLVDGRAADRDRGGQRPGQRAGRGAAGGAHAVLPVAGRGRAVRLQGPHPHPGRFRQATAPTRSPGCWSSPPTAGGLVDDGRRARQRRRGVVAGAGRRARLRRAARAQLPPPKPAQPCRIGARGRRGSGSTGSATRSPGSGPSRTDLGPLRLFARTGPGWPFYARPVPGAGAVTAADSRRCRHGSGRCWCRSRSSGCWATRVPSMARRRCRRPGRRLSCARCWILERRPGADPVSRRPRRAAARSGRRRPGDGVRGRCTGWAAEAFGAAGAVRPAGRRADRAAHRPRRGPGWPGCWSPAGRPGGRRVGTARRGRRGDRRDRDAGGGPRAGVGGRGHRAAGGRGQGRPAPR